MNRSSLPTYIYLPRIDRHLRSLLSHSEFFFGVFNNQEVVLLLLIKESNLASISPLLLAPRRQSQDQNGCVNLNLEIPACAVPVISGS